MPPPVLDDLTTDRARAALADVELLVTGWGCPPLDTAVLDSAPRLRAVVHTAGSVRGHITEACWERGIEVSSAAAANALPVAEYTVAVSRYSASCCSCPACHSFWLHYRRRAWHRAAPRVSLNRTRRASWDR